MTDGRKIVNTFRMKLLAADKVPTKINQALDGNVKKADYSLTSYLCDMGKAKMMCCFDVEKHFQHKDIKLKIEHIKADLK